MEAERCIQCARPTCISGCPVAIDIPRFIRHLVVRDVDGALDVLNEASDYAKPSSFSRGMRVELPGATMLYLSGTASVDEHGATIHPGDFLYGMIPLVAYGALTRVAHRALEHRMAISAGVLLLRERQAEEEERDDGHEAELHSPE